MKSHWFHLMPYQDLPEDFKEKHPSVWVDVSSELFDPARADTNFTTNIWTSWSLPTAWGLMVSA